MKKQLFQLLSLLIFIFSIIALVLMAMAKSNHLIESLQFFGAVAIVIIVLYLDGKWIEKHFIDGEWV